VNHPRYPLVLSASPRAVEQAALLLPGRVLENVVHAAIGAGNLAGCRKVGGRTSVFLDGDIVAIVERTRSPSGRKAWRPVSVERRTPERRVA
jgi:hypothetical protein